jgi:hypothetical protein
MSTSRVLEVTGIDDRCQNPEGFDPREAVMYGFVYFTDDRRVAYATGNGVTSATGNWLPVTPTHVRLAKKYLDENFPGWNELPTKEAVSQ